MHISMPRKLALVAATATLCLAAAACGDDDDEAAEPATTAEQATTPPPATTAGPATTAPPVTTGAPATTSPPETTEAPVTTATAGDLAGFCDAELAVEAAAASEDEAAIGSAIEQLIAAAPPEVAGTVETVVAEFQASGGESEAFAEAYGELIGFVKGNCGFTDLTVEATNYQYSGLPRNVAAGPAVVTLQNKADEFHEMVVFRINDDVTETLIQLLSLPEEEAMSKVTMAGVAFAAPGETAYTAVTLEPGRYAAVCFLPKGATPELMAQMEGPDSSLPEGAGPPHFTHGMAQEFEVA
jgi:hypothetical protein